MLAGNTKLEEMTINIVVDGNKMQSKLNGRCMDEEKPNTIYCGEIHVNKCICKQENSSFSSHRPQRTEEEMGYSGK